ncbi:MAG: DNA repair protein RadC [Lachnospiraceae bacterium]
MKTMKERPVQLRPYERCQQYGPGVLNDAELLAVILRSGSQGENVVEMAERLLALDHRGRGLSGLLYHSLEELKQVRGIGDVKAIQLQCIGELSRRISQDMAKIELCADNPETIANYYMEDLRHSGQEQLVLLMLDTKSQMINDMVISRGTVNASVISPREIFIEALRHQAVYIVLIHNHPSGNPEPSREDILLTRRVKEVGVMVGIQLLDHIIIGNRCFCSLKERGIF